MELQDSIAARWIEEYLKSKACTNTNDVSKECSVEIIKYCHVCTKNVWNYERHIKCRTHVVNENRQSIGKEPICLVVKFTAEEWCNKNE